MAETVQQMAEPNADEWIVRAHANAGQCQLMARAGAAMYRSLRLMPCVCTRTHPYSGDIVKVCIRCKGMQEWEKLIKGETRAS